MHKDNLSIRRIPNWHAFREYLMILSQLKYEFRSGSSPNAKEIRNHKNISEHRLLYRLLSKLPFQPSSHTSNLFQNLSPSISFFYFLVCLSFFSQFSTFFRNYNPFCHQQQQPDDKRAWSQTRSIRFSVHASGEATTQSRSHAIFLRV